MLQSLKSKIAAAAVGACAAVASMVPAFAVDETTGAVDSVAITSDMLAPLVDGVSANIAVILPVGITIFAIFLGIRIIPSIIRRFAGA